MQKKFIRCQQCFNKPATLKCFDTSHSPTRLCFQCDVSFHAGHGKKDIIPYEQMQDSDDVGRGQLYMSQQSLQTPLGQKRQFGAYTQWESEQASRLRDSVEMHAVELRHKLQQQDQESMIGLLKGQLLQAERAYTENLDSMRRQMLEQESSNLTQQIHEECDYRLSQEQFAMEVEKMRQVYEDRVKNYEVQLESERIKSASLQEQLYDTRYSAHSMKINNRRTQDARVNNLQEQLVKARAEVEQRKMHLERTIYDGEQKVQKAQLQAQEEMERAVMKLKQASEKTLSEQREKISANEKLISEQGSQIASLQKTLKEVDAIWSRKNQLLQQDLEEMK